MAIALTDWVITDARGAPTRVPAEFFALFGARVETFTPGRVLLPPTPPAAARQQVSHPPGRRRPDGARQQRRVHRLPRGSACDPGAEWLGRLPRRYRLEYVAPAEPGTPITSEMWPMADGVALRLTGADGIERAARDARRPHRERRLPADGCGATRAGGRPARTAARGRGRRSRVGLSGGRIAGSRARTSSRPMASEAVAAGEGAFRTWITCSDSPSEKSSTIDPSPRSDCARTPDGPKTIWSPRTSGTYRCMSLRNAGFEKSRHISPRPVRRYLKASFWNPRYSSVPAS